jgi:hypothetical protein
LKVVRGFGVMNYCYLKDSIKPLCSVLVRGVVKEMETEKKNIL